MTNFKITVSKDEGESVHGDSPIAYPIKPPKDEICWYTFFKYSRWLHLKIREGDLVVTGELERLAALAMSPDGLVLKTCCENNKYLCHAHAVEEILNLALKGEL